MPSQSHNEELRKQKEFELCQKQIEEMEYLKSCKFKPNIDSDYVPMRERIKNQFMQNTKVSELKTKATTSKKLCYRPILNQNKLNDF